MKVVIAPDSFKGSLTAGEAAQAIRAGWQRVFPDAQFVLLPVADGGEGTRSALVSATSGVTVRQRVTGPLGEPVDAFWGLTGDRKTAIVELADAAGLTLVPPNRRDPKHTTTYGVGELLRSALAVPGVERIIVTLGGSATNDGGAGILSALGVRLLDDVGNELPQGGAALARLGAIDRSCLALPDPLPEILIACDVTNPLLGPGGASAVFGPQKGATTEDVGLLDDALRRFVTVLGIDPWRPGLGAAGGAAAGLLFLFPHATLRPGIDIVLDAIDFERHLYGATIVLTGEGRMDEQTFGGKVVAGVARRARAHGVPTAALVGSLDPAVTLLDFSRQTGIAALMSVPPRPSSLEDAMANAGAWLADAAERAACWYRLGVRGQVSSG